MVRHRSGRAGAQVFTATMLFITAVLAAGAAFAQNPVLPPQMEWKAADPAQRYLQRSLEVYEFKRAAASGVERGREIFYFKCWMCHNPFAKQGGPRLEGLFQRPTLLTGKPVNNENVKELVREGTPNMAAYKFTLADADLDDLVAFVREKCCWNDDEPPLNPRYIAR